MILWKISTAISIKHRMLATFNKKNQNIFNSDSLYAFNIIVNHTKQPSYFASLSLVQLWNRILK
jgi:hypothetical protein